MSKQLTDVISASLLIDELENLTWEDIKSKSFRRCLIEAVENSRKLVEIPNGEIDGE